MKDDEAVLEFRERVCGALPSQADRFQRWLSDYYEPGEPPLLFQEASELLQMTRDSFASGSHGEVQAMFDYVEELLVRDEDPLAEIALLGVLGPLGSSKFDLSHPDWFSPFLRFRCRLGLAEIDAFWQRRPRSRLQNGQSRTDTAISKLR